MNRNSAIVVVDMLYDFIDGSLACIDAEQAVKECARFIDTHKGYPWGNPPVLFIRECHPADHCSFKENGGIWPAHCVKDTHGAEIHDDLKGYVEEGLEFFKGQDSGKEQYSGAEGKNEAGQSLPDVLGVLDCTEVYVCGIATEFCVKNTVLDLLKAGLKVNVVCNALACVNRKGHEEALEDMHREGANLA